MSWLSLMCSRLPHTRPCLAARMLPMSGNPGTCLFLFHPILLLTAMSMVMLAFILSVSMHPRSPPLPRRALAAVLLVAASTFRVCAVAPLLPEDVGWAAVSGLGIRMAVLGAVFAANYFGRRRWLLQFPIVPRPLF